MARKSPEEIEANEFLDERVDAIETGREKFSEFYISLYKSRQQFKSLTEGQIQALLRGKARYIEEQAERDALEPVPTMKGTLTGKILTVRWRTNNYGDRYTMTFLDDRNFKVWGTVPPQIQEEVQNLEEFILIGKGPRISFDASVEPSDTDAKFGFFKRPKNGKILQQYAY